jgi:hypothetical protein
MRTLPESISISVAVIRAMVGANRTTGTVDNVRNFETHSEDTTESHCEPSKDNPYSDYSDSDDEYMAEGTDKKQDQKKNHEEERTNSLRNPECNLKNDDPVSMEHSRKTTETRAETNVVAFT